jgi:hypothetical protein
MTVTGIFFVNMVAERRINRSGESNNAILGQLNVYCQPVGRLSAHHSPPSRQPRLELKEKLPEGQRIPDEAVQGFKA